MAKSDFDAAVVGARIAGATVATLLGERGHRVLVLDRARFPSDTQSTHFFRSPTFRVLDRLGVLESILAVTPRLVNNYNDLEGCVHRTCDRRGGTELLRILAVPALKKRGLDSSVR